MKILVIPDIHGSHEWEETKIFSKEEQERAQSNHLRDTPSAILGYSVYNKEATDAIKSVNVLYGYMPEFLEIYAQAGAASFFNKQIKKSLEWTNERGLPLPPQMSTHGSFTNGKLESQKQYLRQRLTDIGSKSGYALYASYTLLQIEKRLGTSAHHTITH